jgi:hypothetical protein
MLIDHPLKPLSTALIQQGVLSNEGLWMFRGTAQLDDSGTSTVEMPPYFAGLTDQAETTVLLTPVGSEPFAASYVLSDDFASMTLHGQSQRRLSYLVLAARDDPLYRLLAGPAEANKEQERLLYPEAYNRHIDDFVDTMGEFATVELRARALDIRGMAARQLKPLPQSRKATEILERNVIRVGTHDDFESGEELSLEQMLEFIQLIIETSGEGFGHAGYDIPFSQLLVERLFLSEVRIQWIPLRDTDPISEMLQDEVDIIIRSVVHTRSLEEEVLFSRNYNVNDALEPLGICVAHGNQDFVDEIDQVLLDMYRDIDFEQMYLGAFGHLPGWSIDDMVFTPPLEI